MKLHKITACLLLILALFLNACDSMESIHEQYLKGETIYAGKLDSLKVYSGYNRVKIVGLTRYLGNSNVCHVQWNNQSEEFQINGDVGDQFEMIIEGLKEQNYEFEVFTKDVAQNTSIIQTCKGKAIGDIFRNSQLSRRILSKQVNGETLVIKWADRAESEFVVKTLFKYEGKNGQAMEVIVLPDDNSSMVVDWKANGEYEINSAIITGELGFDTIYLDPVAGVLP